MTISRLALLAFLLWEAWWVYEFVTAPRPDPEMQSVFALVMGIFLPALIALPVAAARFRRRTGKHDPLRKPGSN